MTDFSKDAKIFKALCDTKRLTILDYLKSGEKCACVLIENMNIGQSAFSYHMKILCDSFDSFDVRFTFITNITP